MNITSVKRIHQSDWETEGIRFLRARDIVAAAKNEEPEYLYISRQKYEEYSALSGKVAVGDLLVTGVGTIGIPLLIRDLDPVYFKDGNIIWFQNDEKIEGDFFYYSFVGKTIQGFIKDSAGIGTVGTYTIESGKKTPIFLPEKSEQRQIGLFFAALDNLITLHQREYDKIVNIKKALLEKMFPKNGADRPEVRFAGFTDAWGQRKLGDVVKVNSGRDYKHLNTGNIPVYGTGGYMLSVDESLSEVDAIGIGRKGTIDKPQLLSSPFWTVDTLFYMTALYENDLLFLYALSQNIQWAKMDESTGVPSLSKVNIENVDTFIPAVREQSTIGNFFRTLDDVITLHQRELDKLQNVKKALLVKMFA